jgi:hypothetical protein
MDIKSYLDLYAVSSAILGLNFTITAVVYFSGRKIDEEVMVAREWTHKTNNCPLPHQGSQLLPPMGKHFPNLYI